MDGGVCQAAVSFSKINRSPLRHVSVIPDIRQVVTSCERTVVNGRNALRNGDGSQAFAAGKGIIRDMSDAVGNGIAAGFPAGIGIEDGHGFIEEHAVHRSKFWVFTADIDTKQAGAVCKHVITHAGNAGRDRDFCQPCSLEGRVPDIGHAFRDRHACQAGTPTECRIRNAGDSAGDGIGPCLFRRVNEQFCLILIKEYAAGGRIIRVSAVHQDGGEAVAVTEDHITDTVHTGRDRYAFQAGPAESLVSDAGDGIRDRYAFQDTEIGKGIIADTGDAAFNPDFPDTAAVAIPGSFAPVIIRHISVAGNRQDAVFK